MNYLTKTNMTSFICFLCQLGIFCKYIVKRFISLPTSLAFAISCVFSVLDSFTDFLTVFYNANVTVTL